MLQRRGWPGHRRAEATPFFERLCPAMTKGLAVRVGVDDRAPAGAVERLPLSLALGEAIGDGIDHGGVMAHPAMAAFDLDALRLRGGLLHAALPGADAVGPAEDRRGRHRWGDGQRSAEARILF